MKHTARYITLDSVILSYISQANLTDAHYLRLWDIAVRGLERIGLSMGNTPVTRKLGLLPNKTVELPGDYLQWCKVGVLNSDGEIAALHHNRDLTTYGGIDADRMSINTGQINGASEGSVIFSNYWHQGDYYNLFGINSGTENIGEFKVDDVQGIILLDNNFGYDHIILEYLASPTANSDYRIPYQLKEPLIAWCGWKDIESLPASRRVQLGGIAMRRREFYNQLSSTAKYLNPMRLSEANDVIRLSQKLATKS